MSISHIKILSTLKNKVRQLWDKDYLSNTFIQKGASDVVTETDLQFEKEINQTLYDLAPNIPILSEETRSQLPESQSFFTVDPVDGTWNFSHQIPLYGTQIALIENGEPTLGLIYLPRFKDMFTGAKGLGAFLNDKRIHVKEEIPKRSVIAVTDLRNVEPDLKIQLEFSGQVTEHFGRPRMVGCTCFDLAMVACGAYQGKVSYKYNLWDVAPGILLTREAGGYGLLSEKYCIAAASQTLGKELVKCLDRAISKILNTPL